MEKRKEIAVAAVLSALIVLLLYIMMFEDMSHAGWSEIQSFRRQNPHITVTYRIPIDKGVTLSHRTKHAKLTALRQVDSLVEVAEYFQHLETIRFRDVPITGEVLRKLQTAFPHAEVKFQSVDILGEVYSPDAAEIDLSRLTLKEAEDTAAALTLLPQVTTIDLNGDHSVSTVPVEAVGHLTAVNRDAEYIYTTELFGQTISMDMDRIEYFQVEIGDEGVQQFRCILPAMHQLEYFKLDWCGTSDEVMAQLREDYKDEFKVVWRVFVQTKNELFNMLTDTYKIYIQWDVYDKHTEVLKYCNEVRYLDIGHSEITHCDFVAYMPYLDTLIMSVSQLRDIEALRTCKNLTYLEFFMTKVRDLSPLEDLTQLEYLNIGDIRTDDFTPLFGLQNLRKLLSVKNGIPEDMVKATKKALPNCNVIITDVGDYVWDHQWRQGRETPESPYGWMPRYALLRKQIGYDTMDYSKYPGGYVTEEITYESTGIRPPINNR